MSKKQLDTTAIENELSGGASLYFQPHQPKENKSHERSNVETNEVTKKRTNEHPKQTKLKRIKIRHTFDIYQDQLVSLQALQLETFRKGRKKPRLGDLVQKALDLYIKQNQ